nr:hypothetical protein [Magnetovibrio blakemorei]
MSNHQNSDDDDDPPSFFASPPCFMHEIDPVYSGLLNPVDIRQQVDVTRWRKAERERLMLIRQAIGVEQRLEFSQQIATHLDLIIGNPTGLVVSVYWPMRGEPGSARLDRTVNRTQWVLCPACGRREIAALSISALVTRRTPEVRRVEHQDSKSWRERSTEHRDRTCAWFRFILFSSWIWRRLF